LNDKIKTVTGITNRASRTRRMLTGLLKIVLKQQQSATPYLGRQKDWEKL